MERIIIEVDKETARYWNAASDEIKSEVRSILKHALEPDVEDYCRSIHEVRQKTAARGLTPQVFQEIMELDDETMRNLMGKDDQAD